MLEPIRGEVVRIWSALNPDAELQLIDLRVSTKKLSVGIAQDGSPLATGASKVDIFSTAQRITLAISVFLPRAMQSGSPFGFLVLDDPIYAFDSWRVRFLAGELMRLAERYQVIVFTHDDRLWRELLSLGNLPTLVTMRREPRSRIEVETAMRPGELLLQDLDKVLTGEHWRPLGDEAARAVMTLAMCRQAIDTAVTCQVEILGRKIGKHEQQIARDLSGQYRTRERLELLNTYAVAAGLSPMQYTDLEPTINALNEATHGVAPASVATCRDWLDASQRLVRRVYEISA
jgi:hypothetical protein